MAVFKEYEHNPPHLFVEYSKYFFTGATYLRRHYFRTDKAKNRLLYSIRKGFEDSNWSLEDWVILDNHYHIMVDSKNQNSNLSKIIQDIHKFTAIWLNKYDNLYGRRVWFNYWDKCISYESSYFSRLNYIWYNPVKHGYCQYAEDYAFGSFSQRLLEDAEYMEQIRIKFPFDKLDVFDV